MGYKKRCKGFTLVELIVVLVILAVLAALLVPALTEYIDKAKQNSVVAETRMILQAVQTETSELYGSSDWKSLGTAGTIASESGNLAFSIEGGPLNPTQVQNLKDRYKDIVKLAEVPGLTDGTGKFFAGVLATGQVRILVYNDGKGHICLYHIESGKYEVFQTSKVDSTNLESYYGKVFITIDKRGGSENYDFWSYDVFTTRVMPTT